MRTYSRIKNRGFTLIELMIVVAIVGVLAALAVYGVRKYLMNSKTAEARNSIGQMAKDASTAYVKDSMAGTVLPEGTTAAVSNQLCASAGATVPVAIASVAGKKYQSSVAEWNAGGTAVPPTGWACLKFSMSDPQYYMYTYTGAAATFTALANGDLDGNGTTSAFSLTGNVVNNAVHVAPNIVESNPEE